MINLTKLLWGLFCLKAKPADMPFSKILLSLLIVVFVLIKTIATVWFVSVVDELDNKIQISMNIWQAFCVALLWVVILFGSLTALLRYYNFGLRLIQVAIAFVSVDLMLVLFYLVWVFVLAQFSQSEEVNFVASLGLIVGLVLMMYWQFMVYIHILVNSVDITVVRAGVYALVYMLAQHNLAEIMLNSMVMIESNG